MRYQSEKSFCLNGSLDDLTFSVVVSIIRVNGWQDSLKDDSGIIKLDNMCEEQ